MSRFDRHQRRLLAWAWTCAGAAMLIGCDLLPTPAPARIEGCPYSAAEAREADLEDEVFIGLGHVIRYIPSEGDVMYRGYDVVIAETIAGHRFVNETVFLRAEAPVAGIADGEPVLVVAAKTDRTSVFVPGRCVPLAGVDESDVVVR